MPELPEVETMVRGIRPEVEGRIVDAVIQPDCRCRPIQFQPTFRTLAKRVTGCRIRAVRRIAKRVVLELDSDCSMVFEPRMTGLMLLADPPDEEHLRLQLQLRSGRRKTSLWFWDRRGLGTVTLFTPDELAMRLGPGFLGPDALEIEPAEWVRRLSATSREIKVALLDQKLVAGIGNLYASEILHRASIHPQAIASQISRAKLRQLHAVTGEVLHEAIAYEGSTLNDGTYRNALNQQGQYQNAHRVYAREGELCGNCQRETVVRIVQAQRATFFCPRCQRW